MFRVHGLAKIRYCGQCFFVATLGDTGIASSDLADGIIANHMAKAHGPKGVQKTFACSVETCRFSAASKANLNTHMGLVHRLRNNFLCKGWLGSLIEFI